MLNLIDQNNLPFFALLLSSAFIVLLVWILILTLKIKKIQKQSKIFFSGKKGKDLEQIILNQQKTLKNLDNEVQELFDISGKIHKLAYRGIHKTNIIRFNPFKDMGGNQSFVIALLDGKKSGILISSLYTREGTRIYTKPISNGKSETSPLTEEEKKAIKKANISKNINND